MLRTQLTRLRTPQTLDTIGLQTRSFTFTNFFRLKAHRLPPRPKVLEDEIEEVFIKGGGNGGQKINKTNSKVQLKHIPTGLVVSSQFSRSREDNRKRAREILAMKVEELTAPPGQSRKAIVDEFKKKKAANRKKKSKRKYMKLAEEKLAAENVSATGDIEHNESLEAEAKPNSAKEHEI